MNALRRLLLFLGSLLFVACSAVVGVCAIRLDVANYWLRRLEMVFKSGDYLVILLICAALALILGIVGIFVALARKSGPAQVVIGESEGGQVNISLAAVDNVVKKAAQAVTEVRDVKTKLKAVRDGVEVSLHLTVPFEVNVPETAAGVQSAVKAELEGMTGLRVSQVKVLIANVAEEPEKLPVKPR